MLRPAMCQRPPRSNEGVQLIITESRSTQAIDGLCWQTLLDELEQILVRLQTANAQNLLHPYQERHAGPRRSINGGSSRHSGSGSMGVSILAHDSRAFCLDWETPRETVSQNLKYRLQAI
jgi:hypothetical protein